MLWTLLCISNNFISCVKLFNDVKMGIIHWKYKYTFTSIHIKYRLIFIHTEFQYNIKRKLNHRNDNTLSSMAKKSLFAIDVLLIVIYCLCLYHNTLLDRSTRSTFLNKIIGLSFVYSFPLWRPVACDSYSLLACLLRSAVVFHIFILGLTNKTVSIF